MLPLCTSVTLLRFLLDRVLDRGADEALRSGLGDRLDADAASRRGCSSRTRRAAARSASRASGRALLDLEARRRCPRCSRGRSPCRPSRGASPATAHPWNQRTGRRHTYRSRIWRSATLRLRMPPPTGVVSGPLMPMRYSRKASTVSSGSQSPVASKAFSPGEHLLPRDRLAVLRRRRVHHELRRGPDVDARAVTLDEGDDRLVGHVELRRRPA